MNRTIKSVVQLVMIVGDSLISANMMTDTHLPVSLSIVQSAVGPKTVSWLHRVSFELRFWGCLKSPWDSFVKTNGYVRGKLND